MIAQKELSEDEKESWNHFVLEQSEVALRSFGAGGNFLQSVEWGEFQKAIGRGVFYLKDEEWQALIVKHNLPLGKSYLYCPRGPRVSSKFKAQSSKSQFKIQKFFEGIKNFAKQENAMFLRIEPVFEIGERELKELGFVKSKDVQPSKTLILDLSQGEQEIFDNFHPKTRYNANLAGRKGVGVRKSEYNEKEFEELWRLMNQTAKRQRIKIFPKEYYRKQLNPPPATLSVKGEIAPLLAEGGGGGEFKNFLFIAEYQGKAIAANLVNFFGGIATYLHGGWDWEFRSLMAPHFLQWEQIKYAKNIGCKIYDFWGIDEGRWPGITRFKKGFGGREVSYAGTWDFVLRPACYEIYKLTKRIF